MRTEDEMHELVVAKVVAHRRRRTLLASAGGGVAVVLLLVAVAAGAASSGPEEGVQAGEGDPTTTEASTTTTSDVPEHTAPTTTTTAPETTTTTTAPETTTTTEAPTTEVPTTTEPVPSSSGPGPSWPPGVAQLVHGETYGVAYLAVADRFDDPALEAAPGPARAVGYTVATGGQLACDQGAVEALGLDPDVDWYAAAVYFPGAELAQRFVDVYEPEVVGIAEVRTYCLD